MSTFFDIIIKRRFTTLAILLSVSLLLSYGISKLTFNTDYHAFFDDDNPELMAFDAIQKQFVKSDNVMIMLSPEKGDVFTADAMEAIIEMTEASWQIPYSFRVDSLSNFQFTQAKNDELLVEDLIPNNIPLNTDNIRTIRERAINDPDLIHRLLSENGQHTAIYITLNLPKIGDQAQATEIMSAVRKMVASHKEKHPDININISGVLPLDFAFAEVSMKDGQQLIPLTFFVMMLVLLIIFRSFLAVITTMIVVIMSILMAMGVSGWIGMALTPPSASAPLVILTLAIADCVHLIASYHLSATKGSTKTEALREAFNTNIVPIVLTSITSAIGFLGMNFSDAPPFRDLGNITAIGIVFACIYSLIFVPVFMSFFQPPKKVSRGLRLFDGLLNRLIKSIILHPVRILLVGGGIVIGLIAMLPLNTIDDTFVHYIDKSVKFRSDSDAIEEKLTGLYFIDYSINSGSTDGIYNPDFLAITDDFSVWLNQQPEVKHVSSLLNVMKRLNKNLHDDDQNHYQLPSNSEESAQYIFLYEMSLPYGLDLKNQMSFDKSALRVSATLSTISTKQVLDFENRVKIWWSQHSNIQVTSGSPTLMFSHIGMRNIASMVDGSLLALLAVSLIMLLILKSFKFGIISLLPNVAPALMAFGIWGIFIGEVGLAVSVVAVMSLGIVVDDTIHFLYKYLRLRRSGANTQEALEKTVINTGTAILTTSLILAIGFIILSFSNFQVNAQMGLLTAICIVLALLLDLILLPALLLISDKESITEKETVNSPDSQPKITGHSYTKTESIQQN